MQLQSLKKGGYLVAALSAIALSFGTFTAQARAERVIKVYCFRKLRSNTLTFGASASSPGFLSATVYKNGKPVKRINNKKDKSIRKIRGSYKPVSGDRTFKVVARGGKRGGAPDTCIVT